MPFRRVAHPIILGIVGDSAAGKTTLSEGIAAILGADRCATFAADDYHRYGREARRERGLSALNPDANYIEILQQHLGLLRQGQSILKPVYNHDGGVLEAPELFEPKSFIIVEGLLGFTTREMRDCFDVKIYLDPDEKLRARWKHDRDMRKRGYTEEQLAHSLAQRGLDSPIFIRPQRKFADLIVRFRPPLDGEPVPDAQLDVDAVLRPTLPHPDLTPILDREQRDLHLELARDEDGKPVDILKIDGRISGPRADALEDLLWSLLPEASSLRDSVGSVVDSEDNRVKSRPLALTQLLIAYYLVKAAMGEHAI